ncbi:GNAT family N-acetyltransferase [Bacillus cereus]|uniref:GNAT family N-acetyltransferase n=1 Tax=Bacillus cereus TaxID=1396 RepID=UPI000BF77E13|nr:GNAT family N-acetyltransferase [Bacillus cereus]PFA19262.1 GNAT family N-acetyltransferase [Bacillus cereus]PFO85903.1 GNAT family N-acetyltransferase [Bacillus cereus]PFR26052.1 GNAT family N-acetyltransferase [Bacillus cereus]PGZ16414.1 GNAT family N-acetyltransferase [Bacillus cereus]
MFHTDRLQFRKYTMTDLDFYASLWGNEKVMRYIGNGTPKTYVQCKRSLESWVLPSYKNGLGLFLMIEKGTSTPIGHAGLVRQQVDGKEEIEIGYWVLPEYWGKGYAKEAATAFRDYGFQALGLKKLISLINPDHPASIFVARKTGMSYEKTASFHGIDVLVYAIKRAG